MQHFSDTHNKSKWWWRRCAFDTFQESLVKKGLSFLLLADKLNWTNKETLRCLESLSWYHSLRNTQRHHTQASSPPDLMLSDMTFTSRPAQWKAPQVISPSLSLSLPFPSPPNTMLPVWCSPSYGLVPTVTCIHRQHAGTTTNTQMQPSMIGGTDKITYTHSRVRTNDKRRPPTHRFEESYHLGQKGRRRRRRMETSVLFVYWCCEYTKEF